MVLGEVVQGVLLDFWLGRRGSWRWGAVVLVGGGEGVKGWWGGRW